MAELFSIEVFVRKLYSLDTPCYLPSISFRLLDFPTQTINITNIERIEKIQNKIAIKPQSITDLERLKNSRGEVIFNKGKSCLFPMGFDNAVIQLSSIPLFVVLADAVSSKPAFVGSIGISLNEIMMKLQDCVLKSSEICNASVQGSYPIKNLMGSRVGKINLEVKLYYYGTNLVHHIPILSEVAEAQNSSFTERPKDDFLSSTQHITDILHDDKPKQPASAEKKRSDSAEKNSSVSIELDSEADSDKEMDTTENTNPPPLYYQAVTPPHSAPSEGSIHRLQEGKADKRSRTQSERSEKSPRTRTRSRSSEAPVSQFIPHPPAQPAEVGPDYDPTRFGLLRAVLTELTYLTDYLDPKLMSNIIDSVPTTLESAPELQTPLKHTPSAPKGTPKARPSSRPPGKYGLTHSYVLRLARLGPEKASEVLAQHLGKEGAATLMDSYLPKERTPVVNRAVVKSNAKPILVSSHCQTEEMSPRVAWEQSPSTRSTAQSSPALRHRESQQRIHTATQLSSNQGSQRSDSPAAPVLGTTPFSIKERGYESYNRSHGNADHGNHGNSVQHGNTEQSTGSMNMAQVIAAMQAIANTSSRLSNNGELGELVYSDNFEEPSCTSIRAVSSTSIRPHSQASRPMSRHDNRSTSRLSNRGGYNRETSRDTVISVSPNNELIKKKPSRNTRYQKKNVVHYDSDSSSTTTTTSSTHYSYVRSRKSSESRRKSRSKSKSLSRQSSTALERHSSRSISPIKSSTSILVKRVESADSSSPAMSNKGCQTPVPSRSMSIQTNIENESSDNTTTQQTMIKSPVRIQTPHSPFREQRVPSEMTDCHSDHSSLRSGSIYIGDSDEEVSDEDPLKLSFLLSTESVQFSDDDHPTSLLKLCSPSEARVANKFMYTF